MISIRDLAERKKLNIPTLRAFGLREGSNGVKFPYVGVDGRAGRSRLRTALIGADGSQWNPGDARAVVEYANSVHLIQDRQSVWLVEGESDCWVLYAHGRCGIGIPGSGHTDSICGKSLSAFHVVYLVRENTAAATNQTYPYGVDQFISNVTRRLIETGYSGKILVCAPPKGCQDLSDVHTSGMAFDEALADMVRNGQHI